jgi:trans-aconitate methyltransferase
MSREPDPQPERTQLWRADTYSTHARFVSDHGALILDWLAAQPGERVLDLGCGDGALSATMAAGGASVLGVDISEDLLRAARGRGVDARFMDGEALSFDAEFDAVFSNAALHWMTRADQVIAGVWRALMPGGRFVAEFGGHGNVAAIVTAMRAAAERFGGDAALAGPWFNPLPEAYRARLERAGFDVRRLELVARPTHLPSGLEGWLLTFRPAFFAQFTAEQQPAVFDYIAALLRPVLMSEDGRWMADYVRLRFVAIKPN